MARQAIRHQAKIPFRPEFALSTATAHKLQEIQFLEMRIRELVIAPADILENLVTAFVMNTHRSTSLEGNPLTLEQVNRIARETLTRNTVPESLPEKEIRNQTRILLEKSQPLPWDSNFVLKLHAMLLDGVLPKSLTGKYRTKPAFISEGNDVVFAAANPESITKEMKSLLKWLAQMAPGLHPVIAAACFFHEFESIHPFGDGNGRVGRALMHLLLPELGLPNSRFCELEKWIIENPVKYYSILGGADKTGRYEELIEYFADKLLKAYTEAFRRLEKFQGKVSLAAAQLLRSARAHKEEFSVIHARNWVEARSDITVRSRLAELVDAGLLEKEGNTRNQRFRALAMDELIRNELGRLKA